MTSFLDRSDLPRGLRNNNPGNLVQTNIPWKGKIPIHQNTDSRFEQFISVHYGLRALFKDLSNDTKKHNGDVAKIISEFAPSFENNTVSYQNQVFQKVGRTIRNCEEDLIPLAREIVRIENGTQFQHFISLAQYIEAAKDAGITQCNQEKKNPAWLGALFFILTQL